MTWQKLRQQVLERDNYTCQICLKQFTELDIHHVIPQSQQGLDSLNNLTSVCGDCHQLIELRFKKKRIRYPDPSGISFGNSAVRSAKGTKHSTVIITIPREVVDACKLKIGEKMDVLTDGKKIVIKRTERKLL